MWWLRCDIILSSHVFELIPMNMKFVFKHLFFFLDLVDARGGRYLDSGGRVL